MSKENVIVGGIYELKGLDEDKDNPFIHKRRKVQVRVKEVKNNWVLYAILPEFEGSLFQDKSRQCNKFLSIYKLIDIDHEGFKGEAEK